MSQQLSKCISEIITRNEGNKKDAICQLLSLTNTYPNSKTLMKIILLLMEDQHDWINMKKYINQWNFTEFAEGFIERMRTRVNQNTNTKFTNINEEIDWLSDKYWQKLSPKRIIHYENKAKNIAIANQKVKNEKQERDDADKDKDKDKESQKSSIKFKKQIKEPSPKKPIQTVSQQQLPRKGILVNKLSKAPSLQNQKSQSNQLSQNSKKPIQNKSSHLAKLLSGVLTKGRTTENEKKNEKSKEQKQTSVENKKDIKKQEEMIVESQKKEKKEERSEYPILKNLESQHKVTMSPHKSLLDGKGNNPKLRKSGTYQHEAISSSKKNHDFSFSAIREKEQEFNYQSANKKAFDSFYLSQQKSQKKEEKMFIEPLDPTDISFEKFSGREADNQVISPAFNRNVPDKNDKPPQKNKEPESKKKGEFANQFILTVSQMKHINLNPEKKGRNIMNEIYKKYNISAFASLKSMLKEMKEERLNKYS